MDQTYRGMADILKSYAGSDRLYLSPEERRSQTQVLLSGLKAGQFLDTSGISPVLRNTVTIERLLQLKEILDRIELPSLNDIPNREAIARSSAKKWRLPGTAIDIVLIENGPRAGEWLVSADTVNELPEFYEQVKDLPYKPGPAKQLADVYRTISPSGRIHHLRRLFEFAARLASHCTGSLDAEPAGLGKSRHRWHSGMAVARTRLQLFRLPRFRLRRLSPGAPPRSSRRG